MPTDFTFYYKAQNADEAFTRELKRAYPRTYAGHSRYWGKYSDPGVRAAKALKVAADRAWIAEARHDPSFAVCG